MPPASASALPPQVLQYQRQAVEALTTADRALVSLGDRLRASGYRFITVTPATHRRVIAQPTRSFAPLKAVFGWSQPFRSGDLPDDIECLLAEAGMLETVSDEMRSGVRFSTLGDCIFAHSPFPTDQADAVFFGPDTYRFARMIAHSIKAASVRTGLRVLDVGAGSGAGGLYAAGLLKELSPEVVLSDINEQALRFCRINAALNGVQCIATIRSDLYDDVDGRFGLILSNPPYLVDPLARLYRHGGGELGSALSLNIAEQGIARLAPGGQLLLYTGSAIVGGRDEFHEALRSRLAGHPVRFTYEEIDPDVFGEELEHPPYDRADRIAVVGVTIHMQGENS